MKDDIIVIKPKQREYIEQKTKKLSCRIIYLIFLIL